jgi:glycogen debranching enzyme
VVGSQGIYGYPIEIQSLFYMALQCARSMLKLDGGSATRKELAERVDKRLRALRFHLRSYYWLDFERLNSVYR